MRNSDHLVIESFVFSLFYCNCFVLAVYQNDAISSTDYGSSGNRLISGNSKSLEEKSVEFDLDGQTASDGDKKGTVSQKQDENRSTRTPFTGDNVVSISPQVSGGEDISRNITSILNSLLENYDKRLRPNYGGAPVVVSVTIYVSTISAVSEVEMDYTIDMYLRQYWTDPRLAFTGINDSLTIGIDMVKNIWVPDTFFPNEKKSFFHDATTHNGFLRITPDGQMVRSIRLTVTANCPMNLQYFPMDGQNCSLEIESYGYSTKDIIYTWMEGIQAVDIAPDINLAQFSINGYSNYEREISLSTGSYSRLSAHFTFRRNLGFYLIQIYLPSSLIVIISWVSFWLNREATQARVTIGVTTVLTMTTLMTSTNASMPKVSYVKSIDIYLGTCFVIVFASLLEYAAVGYLLKRVKMKREIAEQRAGTVKALPVMMFGNAAAAAAVGGSINGPPLPFVQASKQSLSPANHVQSSHGTPPQCGHGHCNHCYQQSPCMQNRRDSYAATNFSWSRRQGYQTIGSASPHELHHLTSKPYLEPYTSNTEAALACDCDAETSSIFTGDDPPPGVSRRELRYSRRRGRQRHAGHMQKGFRPSSIDKYSRIFFPLTFIVFHVIYWSVYLYTTA